MNKWYWCLADENGTLLKGWQQDQLSWYYLNPNGTMATGWTKVEGNWFYLDTTNGEMKTGWLQDKDSWYYLNPNEGGPKGSMVHDCTLSIDGKSYSFDSNGAMIESLVSPQLIDFIKSFEGFSSIPYQDEVGVWTLGYGMTGAEIQGVSNVTEEQATQMLTNLVNNNYAPPIKNDLDSKNVVLSQSEFDSLVSFAYNVGVSGLLGSTLYRNVCVGVKDAATITSNFQAWSKAGGQTLPGLYKRRTKEANMFLNADYTGNV